MICTSDIGLSERRITLETLRFLMISTHYPPTHIGGDAKFVEYLSTELANKGHEVHVFHSPSAYRLLRKSEQIDTVDSSREGVQRHSFSSRAGTLGPLLALSIGYWRNAGRELDRLRREIRPDVVHWHNTRGFIGIPSKRLGEISIFTSHDYSAVCSRSNLMRPNLVVCDQPRLCMLCNIRWMKPPHLWRAGSRRVVQYPKETRILCPSEFMAKRLREDGVPVFQVLSNFVPDPGHNSLRGTSSRDSLVYLGMLERHKGVSTLTKAFIKSSRDQGFKLHIIGEGSLRGGIADEVARHGMQDRIHVHGFLSRENVEIIRRDAAAQILPSIWYENAPLTALEALSLGVPVIGSDFGGIPEIVGPDSGGRIFHGGNAEDLSKVLVSTWHQRDALKEMSDKARRAYEARFTPEMHLKNYFGIIAQSTN